MNTFYHGDCKFVMNHDIEPNSIDLIYLDPPFFTGKVQKGTLKPTEWHPEEMEVSYDDSRRFWGDSEKAKAVRDKAPEWLKHIAIERPQLAYYLFYMMVRLQACHRVLKDTGSIYLHCDEKASHYLKMIMDEPDVFGYKNYKNEIIWHYGGRGAKAIARKFGKNHDIVLFYVKNSKKEYTFHRQTITRKFTPDEARKHGFRQDNDGTWFKTSPRGDYTDESIKQLEQMNRIHHTKNGKIRIKYPLSINNGMVVEEILIGDNWTDIPDAMHIGKESTGYPSQKPLKLVKRVIETSSNQGDKVLDPTGGCGTCALASQELNRQWIVIDINKQALEVTKGRCKQLPLGMEQELAKAQYITRDLGEVKQLNPFEWHTWVNEYYKATKPFPDGGVDGITTQDGVGIQSKSFKIKYPILSQLITDAVCHPNIRQPVTKVIVASQVGFHDSAIKRQFEIETKMHIKVELVTPEDMLPKQ